MRSLEWFQKSGSEYVLLCFACLLDTWAKYLVQARKKCFLKHLEFFYLLSLIFSNIIWHFEKQFGKTQ